MNAFYVILAVSKAKSEVEHARLLTLLPLARKLDDRESAFSSEILANRRSCGLDDLAKLNPSTKAGRKLEALLRESGELSRDAVHTLNIVQILELLEINQSTQISLSSNLVGPCNEVDRPIVETINQLRRKFLVSVQRIRAFGQ